MNTASPPRYDKETFENFFNDNVFAGPTNTQELHTYTNELLFNQSVDFTGLNVSGAVNKFKVNLESSIRNSFDLNTFIATFELTNNVTLRTDKKLTGRSKYSDVKYYRCQHNTRCVSTTDS